MRRLLTDARAGLAIVVGIANNVANLVGACVIIGEAIGWWDLL